ncbi:hypothetical protein [sulfur-oxidizing endosymbiont of Gigantopelta aegis]|uniref:hypothetical protein n=1 Tax=sulfur-oxidizing endosymbiont of Gigantopelta aegis TaxID=2794934 RepID=UPI0018DD0A6D|nr:hypothetical protein [sulfur-oxidizing endosymbiont of Gigantopelta aegis]
MSSKKLLQQLRNFLDMGKNKRNKYAEELKQLLKELKAKEKSLIEKCAITSSKDKRKMFNRKIAIIHAKRKKGLAALKNN